MANVLTDVLTPCHDPHMRFLGIALALVVLSVVGMVMADTFVAFTTAFDAAQNGAGQ